MKTSLASSRPSAATFAVAALAVAVAMTSLSRIPAVLHDAVDLHRAERWSRRDRPEQAAFVLTMLHHAHPESAPITLALLRAQQKAGDGPALKETFARLQAADPRSADRLRGEFDQTARDRATPMNSAGR